MEGNSTVVEQPVDVQKVEQELKDNTVHLTNGPSRGVGRGEFLMAAKNYKPKIEVVDLPAPFEGRSMKVKELNAGERDKYESKIVKGRIGKQTMDMTELRIGLIIASAVDWDDESSPLFSDKDKEYLKNMGISVIQAIYEVCSKLSSVTKEDEDDLLGE